MPCVPQGAPATACALTAEPQASAPGARSSAGNPGQGGGVFSVAQIQGENFNIKRREEKRGHMCCSRS